MKNRPMVSIVVPLFNQGRFLDECIDSVTAQTFNDFEVIIVDDCSTDDSGRIADLQTKKDPRIKVIHHAKNMGLPATRNTGIAVARGKYILPLDSDDRIHPAMLIECYRRIRDKKGDIIYTDIQMFGERTDYITMPDYDYDLLRRANHMVCCSMFYKKHWAEVGGYDERLRKGLEDWQFWIKLGSKGHYGFHHPEALFYYRVKENSMITEVRKNYAVVLGELQATLPEIYGEQQ